MFTDGCQNEMGFQRLVKQYFHLSKWCDKNFYCSQNYGEATTNIISQSLGNSLAGKSKTKKGWKNKWVHSKVIQLHSFEKKACASTNFWESAFR